MERIEASGWLILVFVSWLASGCSNSNLSNFQEYHEPISINDSITDDSLDSSFTGENTAMETDSVALEMEAIRKEVSQGEVRRIGESIRVSFDSGIFFDVDSDQLTNEAVDNISALCKIVREYDNTNLLIEGHTDFTGSEEYNLSLSERRAKSVASSAIACGVDPEVIKVKGYGEERPVADNHTTDGRKLNRRVEVVILGDTDESALQRTDKIVINSNDSACFYPPSSSSELARQLCDSWQGRNIDTEDIYPKDEGIFNNPVVKNLEQNMYAYPTGSNDEYDLGNKKSSELSEIKLRGTIYDAKTKEPIEASIILKLLPQGNFFDKIDSDTGEYSISLPTGGHYGFMAKAEGYIPKHDNLYVPKGHKYTEVTQDMFLTPIEVGKAINLNNVFFKQSRADLLPSSYPELDEVVEMMQENPKMSIQLNGHTDNQGNPYMNQRLSEERVEAIKEYLVSKGINSHRIQLKAYGGSRPIASNEYEETRKLNRRVEIVILRY